MSTSQSPHHLLVLEAKLQVAFDGAGKNVQVGSCPASPAKLGLCVAAVEA